MAASKDFVIDVKGEVEILLPAERAVLTVQVHAQSQDKKQTTDATVASARKVETFLRDIGAVKENKKVPIDYWSRTSLREYSHQPHDNERKVNLPREYQATVDFNIRLKKFNVLGKIIHDLVAIEYVQSNGVQWVLTHDTMEGLCEGCGIHKSNALRDERGTSLHTFIEYEVGAGSVGRN